MIMDKLFDNYEDLEEFDDDDEFFDISRIESKSKGVVVNIQHIIDGATTLTEAADMTRMYAEFLDSLENEGFQLYETVRDGSGYAVPQKV